MLPFTRRSPGRLEIFSGLLVKRFVVTQLSDAPLAESYIAPQFLAQRLGLLPVILHLLHTYRSIPFALF